MAGHSRPQDGVASLAYDPAIHDDARQPQSVRLPLWNGLMDARLKAGHDVERACRDRSGSCPAKSPAGESALQTLDSPHQTAPFGAETFIGQIQSQAF
jgi:hypothetical protein